MSKENIFDPYFTFASNSEELLRSFPERLVYTCYEQYIRDFGRFAKKVKLRLPWFVPRDYGGVGLAEYGPWRMTRKDRGCCHLLQGKHFPVIKKDCPWKVHSTVLEMVSEVPKVEERSDYDTWYGYAVKVVYRRAIYFDSFDDLYLDIKEQSLRAVKFCQSIWRSTVRKLTDKCDYRFNPTCTTITKLYPVILL